MSWQSIVQAVVLVAMLVVAVPLLGRYMAAVYGVREDGSAPGDRFFDPIERFIYKVCRIDHKREQRWNIYALSLVAFSLMSVLFLYGLLRLQGSLFFTRAHVNRKWTVVLEVTFAFHGAMVAYLAGQGWQMFLMGGLAMFIITQMHGLGLSRRVRWLIGTGYVAGLGLLYAGRGWQHLPEVAGIPLTLLGGVFVLSLLVLGGRRLLGPA